MQKMKKITVRKERYKQVKLHNLEKRGGYKIGTRELNFVNTDAKQPR